MIHPTIGRVVLYWPPTVSGRAPDTQPWPALVCHVWSETCINLAGFNDGGTPFSASSCRLIQDDDQPPTTGAYAEWMPYQKAQAAKHDTAVGESSGPVSA